MKIRSILSVIGTPSAEDHFVGRRRHWGMEEILTAYCSPWQNLNAERVIGSIRRECLDHIIVLGPIHLKRTLTQYVGYYNEVRTHLPLYKDLADRRPIQSADQGQIIELKKADLNAASEEAAISMIAGTARSMGILVED